MAYEIPQKLQHKERILFGLTFSQLGWACFFGFFIIAIFKMNLSLTFRFFLALFPSTFAIVFMFFSASTWVGHLWRFLSFGSATVNSNSMKKLIPITKVENAILSTSNDLALLKITPLNFTIKTQEEQEAIISGFQKFLNSLDFPVQILVTSSSVNLDHYINRLQKKIKNKQLFEDFSSFLTGLIDKTNMRTREFYLVIPKKSDLSIQCSVCLERLQGIGLQVEQISDKEMLNMLKQFYGTKNRTVEHTSNHLQYLIAPEYVKDTIDSLLVDNSQVRIISAVGYPRTVESGFMDKIISSNDEFDISLHIEPFPIESMMILLNKELQKQRADLYAEQQKQSVNPSLEIKYQDTRKVLEELQKGTQKLFNISFYIACKGASKEQLDLLTKKVEAELNSLMMIPHVPLFRQIQGYQAMMPLAQDSLSTKRNITTQALSAFFPFTSPFLTLDPDGIMMGLNKNKIPFIKDIFQLSNANGVVLATSGSGKSYFTKLLLSRQLLNNTEVLVIDPQNEYIGLTQHCKGQVITISRQSQTIINPLDLMGHDYIEKRLALMDMFRIMFGELTEIQKSILDRAINETYAKKGIRIDSYKNKKMPILGDLYKVLEQMHKKASQMEKVTYRALLNRLYLYTDGVFSFLNTQSTLDFNNKMVCFTIGDMPKQVKPLIMFLILDFVYLKMKESKKKKLLVIDEAWSLLSKADEASYIFEIVKTCRKFNLGLLLITQDVADLLNSKAGHAVLANSSYTFLLRQKPSVIGSVVKSFNLSDMEKEYLLSATKGKGILIMDNDHQELEVVASPQEHQLITTNPNEPIVNSSKKIKEQTNISISLNLEQGLYFGSDLGIEEKNYLGNHGYQVGNFMPIGKSRQEECWVKTNEIESIDHTFLVQNIKLELLKITKKVDVFVTGKPDVVAKVKNKNFAFEVETGKGFSKHKRRLKQKFHEAHLAYKDHLYIVLTSSDYKRHYTKLCRKVPVLTRTDLQPLFQTLKRYNKSK